jgi:hypothetical protein
VPSSPQICHLCTCFELVADDLCGAGHVFKSDVGDGAHFQRGSAGLAWRRGRGMSGSEGQWDKAGRMWDAGLLAWVPMSGGRLGSARLASSGVLPVGEGGGDEGQRHPGRAVR